MTYQIFQVDAFAERPFTGNPAAVVPLSGFLPDEIMQSIAEENNLSETAFVVETGDGAYDLRWFTPKAEVRLCGHATLATAHVLWQHLQASSETLTFTTKAGQLIAQRHCDRIIITLPADHPSKIDADPSIETMLGCTVAEWYRGTDDLIAVIDSIETLHSISPDYKAISQLKTRGIIVTCRDGETSIACRCFYPAVGIDEDPFTGSAHTTLVPLWTRALNTNVFTSRQVSARGGTVECIYKGDTVGLIGSAFTYLEGIITV